MIAAAVDAVVGDGLSDEQETVSAGAMATVPRSAAAAAAAPDGGDGFGVFTVD